MPEHKGLLCVAVALAVCVCGCVWPRGAVALCCGVAVRCFVGGPWPCTAAWFCMAPVWLSCSAVGHPTPMQRVKEGKPMGSERRMPREGPLPFGACFAQGATRGGRPVPPTQQSATQDSSSGVRWCSFKTNGQLSFQRLETGWAFQTRGPPMLLWSEFFLLKNAIKGARPPPVGVQRSTEKASGENSKCCTVKINFDSCDSRTLGSQIPPPHPTPPHPTPPHPTSLHPTPPPPHPTPPHLTPPHPTPPHPTPPHPTPPHPTPPHPTSLHPTSLHPTPPHPTPPHPTPRCKACLRPQLSRPLETDWTQTFFE